MDCKLWMLLIIHGCLLGMSRQPVSMVGEFVLEEFGGPVCFPNCPVGPLGAPF